MLETTTGFFGWPLADGLARGLARYKEKYGGDPPTIWVRTPEAASLGEIPIRADASVPKDLAYFGPVPLLTATTAALERAGYEQEVLVL